MMYEYETSTYDAVGYFYETLVCVDIVSGNRDRLVGMLL